MITWLEGLLGLQLDGVSVLVGLVVGGTVAILGGLVGRLIAGDL